MSSASNQIGSYGEYVAAQLLLRRYSGKSYFDTVFLGDKYPTVDLLVELAEPPIGTGIVPYFFVQVKATNQPTFTLGKRLGIQVRPKSVAKLLAYPAPTYIVGINTAPNPAEGFIFAARQGGPLSVSSIPTSHSIAVEATLQALYDEVLTFWQANPVNFTHSIFV